MITELPAEDAVSKSASDLIGTVTRRWHKPVSLPKPQANKFHAVAETVFYPLLQKYDLDMLTMFLNGNADFCSGTLSLLGEDAYVLAQLVSTLASFLILVG